MPKRIIFMSLLYVSCLPFVFGCRWQDDFRIQRQPQYRQIEPQATFNEDSDYYVGDEIAKEGVDELEIAKPEVPSIDALSEIPPVPEHPVPR